MDENKVESEYNRIKNLKQYKNYTEEQLRSVAYNRAIELQVDIDDLFVDEEDKKKGKSLLKKYLNDYTPETISDINTLRSILFLEILTGRFQQELNKKHSDGQDIPIRTTETIHKNLNEILVLKDSLGLTKDKKTGTAKSIDHKIALMRKQFKAWLGENQASRQVVCPYCGQLFLLRIRMEHWEAQKHPFFQDRVLYNKPLVDLYLEGVVTKEKLAEILECSPDYIDWVISKVHKNK